MQWQFRGGAFQMAFTPGVYSERWDKKYDIYTTTWEISAIWLA